ncbi:hypothetical protein CGCSCA5_v006383 [Colletotrichum siamense]|nr:hypothetical protein CGCSCA5_v006383 [Colletotrichum siamense]
MASVGEFDGYEFSNNLVSDLAPLVALFGEQVTTQFLGLSMGWADNVLLAMGPLGIITILMSAIRIGGGRKLKSLVGRAREPQAVAEQELLSSTSANVCELWNGQQVVRIIGEPIGMKTVVATSDGKIQSLREALEDDNFTVDRINDQSDNSNHPRDDPDTEFEELLVKPFRANRAFQYAQELFSLFILALGLETESIDEKKQKKSIDGDHKVSREHPVFKRIADILVEKKLVRSTQEAYILIIPAFAKHKLLPKDPGRSVSTGRQDQVD